MNYIKKNLYNFLSCNLLIVNNFEQNRTFNRIRCKINSTLKQLWQNKKMVKWQNTRLNTLPCNQCSGLGESQKINE